MAKETKTSPPPKRKEPGLIGKGFGWIMGMIYWLLMSLVFSVAIEWAGIAFIWQEEGSTHSEKVLQQDYRYLNERVAHSANRLVAGIRNTANQVNHSIENSNGFTNAKKRLRNNQNARVVYQWITTIEKECQPYLESVPNILQIFFVRQAILILSMPAFLLFGVIGLVDGLVERDLRRWGGGRESSVMYNIARKSVFRFFIGACVIYLSFPDSIAPAWIIIPFAVAFGLSVRITFERFKKYL